MHKKQRGKNEERKTKATRKATQFQLKYQNIPYQNQNIICLSRKNIVPLSGGSRGYRKNSLSERDEHRTPTLRNTAEKTGHLCWMASNPMNDVLNPNAIPENERWWDVGIIFRRNEQSYAD